MSSVLFHAEFAELFAAMLPVLQDKPVAVIGHARPDGDCIGSQIAIARVLRSRGVDVVCGNPDPVPRRLQFLTADFAFRRAEEIEAERLAIFVDCADHARPGEKMRTRFPAPFANIDHHLSNRGYAEHNFVDTTSAATCEIIAGILLDNNLPIDELSAHALYTGIITDTGQFRFSSTSRRTFLIAGELVARGAQPSTVGLELYERETPGRLQLLQRFLASLKMECGGKVCIGVLPAGIFEETGTTAEDTEGLVDYARSIEGVDIGVLVEVRADGVKASLRCKDPAFRVDQVAALFNGGGHACAAGLNVKGEAAHGFIERLVEALALRIATVATAKSLS